MPAIWSSSERPISVRTVWVDGIRHAILSPDDPLINPKLRRRSRVSRNKNYSTEYQQLESRLERLNSCFTNLRMVVGTENKPPPQVYRKLSAPPCPRMSIGTADISTLESPLSINRRIEKTPEEDTDPFTARSAFKQESYERTSETNSKANATECKQIEGTSDSFWNPLFERVLQWLDLSGRAQSYDFEEDFVERSPREEERKWSPAKKRFPRLKRECPEEKERITLKNYKLHKERHLKEENKALENRLPKIKITKERFRENNETIMDPLFYSVDNAKMSLKLYEDRTKNETKAREKSSTMWSPPGRFKLHVVIPNINSMENHTSSQESLIND